MLTMFISPLNYPSFKSLYGEPDETITCLDRGGKYYNVDVFRNSRGFIYCLLIPTELHYYPFWLP